MEVIKIRLQAQHHSMADPLDIPKYRNAAHALYTVVKEEGIGALYRGISLTALRQGMTLDFESEESLDVKTLHRFESSSQLHCLHEVQGDSSGMATAISSHCHPQLPDHNHWSCFRRYGPAQQRSH